MRKNLTSYFNTISSDTFLKITKSGCFVGTSRTLEPVVELLFAIVKQDLAKDVKHSEQILVEAKELIKTIRRLEDSKKLAYEELSKTLSKEIKFENDINLDAKDKDGVTFLIWASLKGHTALIDLLLEQKANPNLANKQMSITPLISAAYNGHTESVRLLLEHKAIPDIAAEESGRTPLISAAYNGHTEIVHLLVEHKANPNLANEKMGPTPLTYAADHGHHKSVYLLLAHKANPNLTNKKTGGTPLVYAAKYGKTESVRLLLEHKAIPDKAGEKSGRTPLTLAASNGQTDIINLLLGANAKVDLPTREGKTALDCAIEKQNLEMIILLLRHEAVINSPESLFNHLIKYDPRNPDVLFALDNLIEQQNNLRKLKIADAKISVLREDKYKEIEKYHTQLSKVSERLQVSRKLLDTAVCETLPIPILDIICKLDAPLYRLKDSDTLFSEKKQIDQFRKELAKKHKEFFQSRWNPIG